MYHIRVCFVFFFEGKSRSFLPLMCTRISPDCEKSSKIHAFHVVELKRSAHHVKNPILSTKRQEIVHIQHKQNMRLRARSLSYDDAIDELENNKSINASILFPTQHQPHCPTSKHHAHPSHRTARKKQTSIFPVGYHPSISQTSFPYIT